MTIVTHTCLKMAIQHHEPNINELSELSRVSAVRYSSPRI